MSITTNFKSFKKVKTWLKHLSIGMKTVAHGTGRLITEASEKIAKERVRSPKRKPGKGAGVYFHSINSNFKEGSVFFEGTLKSDSPIAGVIEFGSRPHIIRSRKNKFLFWNGAIHPIKQVKHPGTPAFRVLGEAVEEAALHTNEKLEQVLKMEFGTRKI